MCEPKESDSDLSSIEDDYSTSCSGSLYLGGTENGSTASLEWDHPMEENGQQNESVESGETVVPGEDNQEPPPEMQEDRGDGNGDNPTREELLSSFNARESHYFHMAEANSRQVQETTARLRSMEQANQVTVEALQRALAENTMLRQQPQTQPSQVVPWVGAAPPHSSDRGQPGPLVGQPSQPRKTFPNAPSYSSSESLGGSNQSAIMVRLPNQPNTAQNPFLGGTAVNQTRPGGGGGESMGLVPSALQTLPGGSPSPTNFFSQQQGVHTSGVKYKPSDIPMLGDEDVVGVDGRANIALFCAAVEDAATSDVDRLKIARMRLKGRIQKTVGTRMFAKKMTTYIQLKYFLFEEISDVGNPDEGWASIESMDYDQGVLDARSYVNAVFMQHDMLVTKFPNEIFPRVENLIKRKLVEQAPAQIKAQMKPWMEERVQISKFLEMLRRRTESVEMAGYQGVNYVPQGTSLTNIPTSAPQRVNLVPQPTQTASMLDFQGQIDSVKQMLATLTQNKGFSSTQDYCVFCRIRGHLLRDCPQSPPRGVCWACFDPNHRRGDPKCPKYVAPKARQTVQTTTQPAPPSA